MCCCSISFKIKRKLHKKGSYNKTQYNNMMSVTYVSFQKPLTLKKQLQHNPSTTTWCQLHIPQYFHLHVDPQDHAITITNRHPSTIRIQLPNCPTSSLTEHFPQYPTRPWILTSCSSSLILLSSPGMIFFDLLHISGSIHLKNLQPPSAWKFKKQLTQRNLMPFENRLQ